LQPGVASLEVFLLGGGGETQLPGSPFSVNIVQALDWEKTVAEGNGIGKPVGEKDCYFTVWVKDVLGNAFDLPTVPRKLQHLESATGLLSGTADQELREARERIEGMRLTETAEAMLDLICDDLSEKSELLYEMLSRLDKDMNHIIDCDDLTEFLKDLGRSTAFTAAQIKQVVQVLDKDGSGKVDYDEFYMLVHSWRVMRRYTDDDVQYEGLDVEFEAGDNKTKGGEAGAEIAGELVHIRKKGAGCYRVTYIPRKSGKVLVHVKLNGRELRGSPYTADVMQSASERLYLMNVVLGIEINVEDTKGKGCEILNVRKSGPADSSGVLKGEFIKEIEGVYIADNKVFEEMVLTKTAGDRVNVVIVSKKGAERNVELFAGAKGTTVSEVQILRIEAEDETPWEDKAVFDRARFAELHPYLPQRGFKRTPSGHVGTRTKYKTQGTGGPKKSGIKFGGVFIEDPYSTKKKPPASSSPSPSSSISSTGRRR